MNMRPPLTWAAIAAKPSKFPQTDRQIEQTIGSARNFVEVENPDNLAIAIANAVFADESRGVRITKSMTLGGKLIIPETARGIYLTAAPGVVLYSEHDDFALQVEGFPFFLDSVRFQREGGSVSCLSVAPSLTKFDAGQVFTMRDCAFDEYTAPLAITASGTGILRFVLDNIVLSASSTMSATLGSSNARGIVRGIYPANPNTQSIDFTVASSFGDYEAIDCGTAGTLTASGTRNTFKSVRNPGGLASTMTSGYLINVSDTAGASGTDVIL